VYFHNGHQARVISGVDGTCLLCNNGVEFVSHLIWCHDNIDFYITMDDDVGSIVERWLESSICSFATFEHGVYDHMVGVKK